MSSPSSTPPIHVVAVSLPGFPNFQIDVGTVQRISELPLDQQLPALQQIARQVQQATLASVPPSATQTQPLSVQSQSQSQQSESKSAAAAVAAPVAAPPLLPPAATGRRPPPEAPKAKRAKRIPMKLQAAASSAPASDKPLMRAAEAVLSADHDANNGDADIDANGDVDVTDEDEASAAVPDSSHHFKPSSDVVLLKQVG